METAEVEARVEHSDEASTPEPRRAGPEMYRYSRWVHIGPSADECEDVDEVAGTNQCNNPLHFHAWVRLPNKLQREDLENEGKAAQARAHLVLRDEESNARVRLEAELEPLRRDGSLEVMATAILRDEWGKTYLQATREIREEEEEKYGELDKHKMRYQELYEKHSEQPTEEWPDELNALDKLIREYLDAVKERVVAIQEPHKQALMALGRDGLVDQLRDKRIDEEGIQAYQGAYNLHEWLVCTYMAPGKAGGRTRRWESKEAMRDEAPEVLDAIEAAFNELELALHQGTAGNS